MANELNAVLDPESDAELTVVAQLYTNAGAQVGPDIACVEAGGTAIYVGDMPTAAAGVYTVRFLSGSTCVAQGTIEWDGSAEITGVSLNTAAQATLEDTDELQQNQGNFATATGFSTLTAAEVNSEVDSAISDANLATAQSVADLNDPSAAEVAVAVRSELTTELSRIDETIGSRSTLTPAEVNAEVDAALAEYDPPTNAEMSSATADIGLIRDRTLDIQLNVQQTNN